MADGQPVNGMYSDVMARHTAAAAVRVESPAQGVSTARKPKGRIHGGDIRKDTSAGRLYRYLLARRGMWVNAWTIIDDLRFRALHSVAAEVRADEYFKRLGFVLRHRVDRSGGDRRDYYGIFES